MSVFRFLSAEWRAGNEAEVIQALAIPPVGLTAMIVLGALWSPFAGFMALAIAATCEFVAVSRLRVVRERRIAKVWAPDAAWGFPFTCLIPAAIWFGLGIYLHSHFTVLAAWLIAVAAFLTSHGMASAGLPIRPGMASFSPGRGQPRSELAVLIWMCQQFHRKIPHERPAIEPQTKRGRWRFVRREKAASPVPTFFDPGWFAFAGFVLLACGLLATANAWPFGKTLEAQVTDLYLARSTSNKEEREFPIVVVTATNGREFRFEKRDLFDEVGSSPLPVPAEVNVGLVGGQPYRVTARGQDYLLTNGRYVTQVGFLLAFGPFFIGASVVYRLKSGRTGAASRAGMMSPRQPGS